MFYVVIGITLLSFLFFGGFFLSFEGFFNLHGVQFHKVSFEKIAILSKIALVRETSLIIPGLDTLFFYKL